MKQQQRQQQWQQQQQPADFQAMSRKIMKSIEAGRSRGHVNAPQEQQQRHGSGGAHGDSSERDLVVGGADGGFSGHGAGGGNGCCGGIPSLTLRAALANMTPSCKPRRDCGEDNGSGCGDWGDQPPGGNGCFGGGTSGGAGGTALTLAAVNVASVEPPRRPTSGSAAPSLRPSRYHLGRRQRQRPTGIVICDHSFIIV